MADEPKGYTKEKADRLIKQHEEKAAEYDELANTAMFKNEYVREARRAAEEERRKADNLRELERHWGDTPPPERA